MEEKDFNEFMEKIKAEYKPDKDNLIQILNEVQEHFRICTKRNSITNI